MVNFLAAGSIQGLRPLRYERRVARNRFLAFTVLLVFVLIGLFWTLLQQ
jgi:ABC-type microcin C transport system permease subunit YejB